MNKLKFKEGMTLIEIIISLSIFAIFAVIFMNVFLSSIVITTKAGDRSDSVANIAAAIDNRIAGYTSDSALLSTTSGPFYVTVNFSNGTSSTVSGITLKSVPEQKAELKYFLPN